jgi:transketolase
MRREFSRWVEGHGTRDPRLVFLTGDLGYGALENVRATLGPRFINIGVCEQNMISMAAGLAHEGLLPLCYSIAPFAVFRPFEQIRLDVAVHNLPVRIVGNGGGYGYGIMGASHHALEDLAVLSCLPNFRCMAPISDSDVPGACEALFAHPGPGYLRLGLGHWVEDFGSLPAFAPVRRICGRSGGAPPKVTVAGLGPVLLNLLPWLPDSMPTEIFAVSVLPVPDPFPELVESVRATGLLWVVEEHSERGGLAECLARELAIRGIHFRMIHSHAKGYPGGLYGSQSYHLRNSGLDADSLKVVASSIDGR